MAKKQPTIIKDQIIPEVTTKDIFDISKNKGYTGEDSIYLIQVWIRNIHHLHGEVFYSIFHKKWGINNFFVNIVKGDRIPWENYKSVNYDSYDDALVILLYNLLSLIKWEIS